MSISSASVSVTACPATPASRSCSNPTTRFTVVSRPAGRTTTRSPGATRPAGDHPGEAPELGARAVHPLHRQPERRVLHPLLVDLDGLEVLHQRRPGVPGHLLGALGHVVAAERRKRDQRELLEPELLGEGAVLALDLPEPLLRVVDEIHLVHGDGDVADPEQVDEVAVAPRLREHALARVEQDQRAVGGRGAGDHVARVLLVPRRVGDDVLPGVGREEAVGDVDRDPLLALGGEPVEEQREVELLALRPVPARVGLERRQLVLEQHLRLVEQPADQRRLPVVDRAARDEAQEALVLVRVEVGVDVALECRLGRLIRSSPRPSSSPSRRPCRSRSAGPAARTCSRAASPG